MKLFDDDLNRQATEYPDTRVCNMRMYLATLDDLTAVNVGPSESFLSVRSQIYVFA